MPASGTEAVQLSQLRTYKQHVDSQLSGKQDTISFPLSVAQGGTGATDAAGARTALGAASTSDLSGKLDAPSTGGSEGQVLVWNGTATEWQTISTGATYTGSNGISVSGTVISGVDAGEGTKGVVEFATSEDFSSYMELS